MENVSKALIMAGTVLLALLLIGIFVRLFDAGSKVSETYDKKQQVEQLELYNSQFELYDKNNNTIMELITVANLAYSVNEQHEYDLAHNVEIEIKAGSQKFIIPNVYYPENIDKNLKRNQIQLDVITDTFDKKNISIYELATANLKALGINDNENDTLLLTKYEFDSTTKVNDYKTYYKYTFKCDEILYEHENGKVSKMTFSMNTPDANF